MNNVEKTGWFLRGLQELKRVWELMLQSPGGYASCCIGLPDTRAQHVARGGCR